MKKQITVLMFAIILIGSIIAGVSIIKKDKNIYLTKEQKSALKNIGLESYNINDYEIGNDYIKRCIYKKNVLNTCRRITTFWMNCTLINKTSNICVNKIRINYSKSELNFMLDNWEKQRLENIADTKISRDKKTKVKIGGGITTIMEK